MTQPTEQQLRGKDPELQKLKTLIGTLSYQTRIETCFSQSVMRKTKDLPQYL